MSGPLESLTFGRIRFSPAQRALWVDGEPAHLGARAFDVLAALIERRERLVSKNELLDVVWPKLVVEDNNLQVQISALRKLLGPDVIATIPGRGYKFTALLDGGREATMARRPVAAPLVARLPTNLPVELLPLYGREADVQAVRRLLENHRLVTIAGAGGIGKTRVGEAVAHALRDEFAQGVWAVELAPLADSTLVAATVAQVLGHQLRSAGEPINELATLLESQRLLLLIDNCEHLVNTVSQMAQALLGKAPNVYMLVTTQEPLRLPDERLYRLGTLDVPGSEEPLSAAQALQHGAVRLFVERAHALDRLFALDERNVQAVVDICRQLDGLALAVEMAAARVPVLGVQGVRARLGERLRILTAGSRIALRRHQTLRAALDWSHSLLEEQDQVVFRRLGVFSGGCTVEAVQQVASDAQLDEWTVLDAIGRLVDRSLIVADGEDRPRYRMLESARAYALEKLAAARETDALARRHASCYAAYAERIHGVFFAAGGTEDGFIAARAAEFANLRAAIKWGLGEGGDAGIALVLLAHISPFGWVATSRAESEAWLSALKRCLANESLAPREIALHRAVEISWGFLTAVLSRASIDAEGTWPPVRQALLPLGDRWRAYCAYTWAVANGRRGELDVILAALDEAKQFEVSEWPAWLAAYRLLSIIRATDLVGVYTPEVSELPAMFARLQQEGDSTGRTAFAIGTLLAEDQLLHGQFEASAKGLLELAEQGRRQRTDTMRMMLLFPALILALTELDRLDEAREAVVEAMPLVRWFAWRGPVAPILALLAARRGRLATAARLLAAGEARVGGGFSLIGRHAKRRALDLLARAHADDHLSIWAREGAAFNDDEFDRLVIDEV
jgi:predicted ATPase